MRLTQQALVATLLTTSLLTACQPKADENATPAGDSTQVLEHDVTHSHEPTDGQATGAMEHGADHDMAHDHEAMTAFGQEYHEGMMTMHEDMMAGMMANDADVAFAKGMLAHHQGAVAMAKTQLKYGQDETMNTLAQDIINAQQSEIEQMQNWLASHPDTGSQPNTKAMQQAYEQSMQPMHGDMMEGIQDSDADMAFAKGMLAHHQGAIAMSKVQLEYGQDPEMNKLAQDIIDAQQSEIELMQNWISEHSA
ncbi:CopM family metallochaperone [Psychrobacter pygoscelis]|uniref:CopM family metallochaperone n=1 Tax=Psychrobacter pygoscelis TaxID=2488563 RepID=UPI001040CD26|nr:DUF305 domain-containing protein [Psychrobacter pygoscelis]